MIYDNIKNYKLYTGLGPDFKEAFDFIVNNNNFKKSPPGRYDMNNGLYYMIQNYETKPESEGFFETHRKYIDLQYVLSGKERHDFAHFSALELKTPYDAEKDILVYGGKGCTLILEEGFFVVYYPEDAHMPNLRTGVDSQKMIKMVVKIPVR